MQPTQIYRQKYPNKIPQDTNAILVLMTHSGWYAGKIANKSVNQNISYFKSESFTELFKSNCIVYFIEFRIFLWYLNIYKKFFHNPVILWFL